MPVPSWRWEAHFDSFWENVCRYLSLDPQHVSVVPPSIIKESFISTSVSSNTSLKLVHLPFEHRAGLTLRILSRQPCLPRILSCDFTFVLWYFGWVSCWAIHTSSPKCVSIKEIIWYKEKYRWYIDTAQIGKAVHKWQTSEKYWIGIIQGQYSPLRASHSYVNNSVFYSKFQIQVNIVLWVDQHPGPFQNPTWIQIDEIISQTITIYL